jgi:hypothetical protein
MPAADQPDPVEPEPVPSHLRPPGLDDLTALALGRFSEALETTERARGHLYAMHQLTGKADFALDDVIMLLYQAGHHDLAERIRTELIGRNVIPGRWTFQLVEEYDDGYYRLFRELERTAREQLAGGRRHLHEAALKARRRTPGMPGHELCPEPPAAGDDG